MDIGQTEIYKSTQVLSGLLLAFTIVGTGAIAYFALSLFAQYCCQGQADCPSPRQIIMCCFGACRSKGDMDVEAQKEKKDRREKRLERRTMSDNRLSPDEWSKTGTAERERMKRTAKAKNTFELIVLCLLLFGGGIAVGVYAWMELVAAEETFASEL